LKGRRGLDREEHSFTTAIRAKKSTNARVIVINEFSVSRFIIGSCRAVANPLKSGVFVWYRAVEEASAVTMTIKPLFLPSIRRFGVRATK